MRRRWHDGEGRADAEEKEQGKATAALRASVAEALAEAPIRLLEQCIEEHEAIVSAGGLVAKEPAAALAALPQAAVAAAVQEAPQAVRESEEEDSSAMSAGCGKNSNRES